MGALPHASSFRNLVVYRKAFAAAQRVFELTRTFPKEETYSLTDQIRRSSRSIGAQIAEAWAKRRYEKHFVSKLTDADGEQLETQHWIATAEACGYIDGETAKELNAGLEEIGRMLSGVVRKSALFCGERPDRVGEELAPYFTNEQETDSDSGPPLTAN